EAPHLRSLEEGHRPGDEALAGRRAERRLSFVAAVSLPIAGATLLSSGLRVARRLAPDLPGYARTAIGAGLGASCFVTVVCLAARASGAFDVGLAAAAALGLLSAVAIGRLELPPLEAPPPDHAIRRRLGWALAAITVLYAVIAWSYQIHDEHPI